MEIYGYWTEAQVETLKALTKLGQTASHIGKQMGRSRNAVIGKWYRLRMGPGVQSNWYEANVKALRQMELNGYRPIEIAAKLGLKVEIVERKLDRMQKERERRNAKAKAFRGNVRPRLVPLVPKPIRVSKANPIGIKFMDLSGEHCRYIIGDVTGIDTFYCGSEKEKGQSYCSPHCAECFVASRYA
jgi:hypothetical protein